MNGTDSSAKHYDMVVIGSGAAEHHGTIQAAKLGKKVAVVERSRAVGGRVFNTSTIPSKTLREAVLGSTRSGCTDSRILASDLARRIEDVASNEVRVFENQFRRNDTAVLIGTASFGGPHTIRVTNQEAEYFCHADHGLIAVGSPPTHSLKPGSI
jgi:NAD(P) transhydrogenase